MMQSTLNCLVVEIVLYNKNCLVLSLILLLVFIDRISMHCYGEKVQFGKFKLLECLSFENCSFGVF